MPTEFQIGDIVGDYQVIGVLGAGGMGKVFQVRNRLSDRVEAMKVILPGREDDPDLAGRFLREIKLQASLDHPNIAALRTALQVDRRILMILEFVDGLSLQEKLRGGPLPIDDGIDCVRQVLAALAFAHARNVTHRDIKPPNIILTPAGLVKLTDFGIARCSGDETITSTGMAVGSLAYIAPEQIEGAPAGPRSDLYSLGVTFYETIAGKRPFEGENEYALMHAHLAGNPVAPSQVNPEIAPELSAVMMKALARDPERRFQTAAEFQSALAAFGRPAAFAAAATSRQVVAFDPGDLARLEANLRPTLGPIARHLVTQAARECATMEQLRQRLADQIPEIPQREAFLRRCETTPIPSTTIARGAAPAWEPAAIETLKRRLAAYLGPIAPVMVAKQMRRAGTIQELYQSLAAQIPTERDRQAFLSSLPS